MRESQMDNLWTWKQNKNENKKKDPMCKCAREKAEILCFPQWNVHIL